MTNKKLAIASLLTASLVALGIGQSKLQAPTIAASNDVMAPAFLVDPLWPKPLPNHWITGNTIVYFTGSCSICGLWWSVAISN